MIKVSVLSAVRNEGKYIGEMIDSVRSQSMKEWELIIVDDGSTDDTVSKAENASRGDSRIRTLLSAGSDGKVAAFNRAYAESKGDVVVLLGGDDTLPVESLALRSSALVGAKGPAAACFKLRTMSTDRKVDGMVLPRGDRGNRSGGTIALNKALAELVFPIDDSLVSEDLWVQYAAVGCGIQMIESSDVVLNYRIHPGNSNPRGLAFPAMSAALHDRQIAYETLLSSKSMRLNKVTRARLQQLAEAEVLRCDGRVLRLLMKPGLPVKDRLAFASAASPALYQLRTRYYRAFSGHRRG